MFVQAVWPCSQSMSETTPPMVYNFNSWFAEYGECQRVTKPIVPLDQQADVGWVTKRPQVGLSAVRFQRNSTFHDQEKTL